MPPKNKKIIKKREKIYFIYFLIFTLFILIIFAWQIISPSWDYWTEIWATEKYYKAKMQKFITVKPSINQYDPIKGQISAKVTIYEYSDFYCSGCKALNTDLQAIADFYGNRIRFVYKGIPVTVNPQARPAMIATMCAGEQGNYWDYKQLIYKDPNSLDQQIYLQYAQQLNLDLDLFNQCLTSPRYTQVIERNLTEALRLQITSVPTLYVNDQKLEGFLNYDLIKSTIDSQL